MFCLTFWLVLNITSAKLAIRANNFFTVLKIALLVLLICVGFAGFAGRLPNRPDLVENFSFHGTSNNPGSYATAIYYVIYAYGGWFNLNYVLDELKDPIKNLPKCAISALSLTTVLYILANIGKALESAVLRRLTFLLNSLPCRSSCCCNQKFKANSCCKSVQHSTWRCLWWPGLARPCWNVIIWLCRRYLLLWFTDCIRSGPYRLSSV